MSTVNLLTVKSNNKIMADSLLNVQNIQLKDTSFTQRSANLIPDLAIGLPLTGALVTAPYWGKPFAKPFSAFSLGRKNEIPFKDAWKILTEKAKNDKLSRLYLTENESWWQGRKNIHNYNKIADLEKGLPKFNASQKITNPIKQLNKLRTESCYSKARALIEEAKTKKLTGNALKKQLKLIVQAIGEGDAKVHEMRVSGKLATSKAGNAANWIKDKTKFNTLKGNILAGTKGSSALRIASKGAKGAGIFAIIGGLLEIPNLMSAHEADKAEKAQGRDSNYLGRQVVKSTVKVGANVLGYAAGAAAAGAALGSVVPLAGNVVGAIVGFIGGCIGAMATGYVADKMVGEHTAAEEYAQKIDEDNKKNSNILAKEADSNSETRDQLLMAMYEKIQSGEVSDAEVIKAFEKELEKRNTQNSSSEIAQISTTNNQNSEYSSLINQLNELKNSCNNVYYNA